MKFLRSAALAAAFVAMSFAALPGSASAAGCGVNRPIIFGDLDWDSALFHNAVARFIIEKGFGCATDSIPGTTIPLLGGVARGDVDIVMEVWTNNQPDVWTKALKEKKVAEIGVTYEDAVQHWYVPRYLVEGAYAPAKDLKSVADLRKYKVLFQDQEEPSKGRFYNCIAGWICETVNSKKMHAYGLDADFVNFRPGTGAALAAAVESAIKREQPILFYYWGPSWLMGKFGSQLVALEEPVYDEAIWQEMMAAGDETKVTKATAYPTVEVVTGMNTVFAQKAPGIVAFLRLYRTTGAITSEALAYMQANGVSTDQAAQHFLKTYPDVWGKWVPADVAKKVREAL